MLDEPSAGLNRDEREDLARFILRIKHELGLSIIWIEHDMQNGRRPRRPPARAGVRPQPGRRDARRGAHDPRVRRGLSRYSCCAPAP